MKIGIVPAGKLFLTKDPYQDAYTFVNNYGKRIIKNGGEIIGLIPVDGVLPNDELALCDGFIITGGAIVNNYQLQVIDYSLKNNKPLLAICLGMHAIGVLNELKYEAKTRNIDIYNLEELKNLRKILHDEKFKYLKELSEEEKSVHSNYVERDTIETGKHQIHINKDSILYSIYQKEILNVPSMHSYSLKSVPEGFKISATALDGNIEAIECVNDKQFILGVQFHPELEDENDCLFKRLILETKNRTKSN